MPHAEPLLQALDSLDARSRDAAASGALAFARLLEFAEQAHSDAVARRCVLRFIAAAYTGQAFEFPPIDPRAIDIDISIDMLRCIDAQRWGHHDLLARVPDGDARVRSVVAGWSLQCFYDG